MYWELARECASKIYSKTPPNAVYVEATANLLVGTAATESGFIYRRQKGFDLTDSRGAWGLWQIEEASVKDNIERLQRDEPLRKNCSMFLLGHEDMTGILNVRSHCLLRMIYSWDKLAILMCRLHYFKFKAAIPKDFQAQAEYYKIYYNTMLGKGSPEKYMKDWNTYVKGKIV